MKLLSGLGLAVALIAVLWVIGCRQAAPDTSATPPQATATAPAAAAVTIGADEASCPVLGTVMKKSAMKPVVVDGKTYYLCCSDCVRKFKADPQKYITHPAPPTRDMKM